MALLDPGNRVELGFLLIAGVAAFVIPVTGQINLVFGVALLAWFGFYLYKLTRGDVEEPELIGTAAAIGALPDRTRRTTVIALFVLAAAVILACAEPFAESLVGAGTSWASTSSCWCSGWRRWPRRRRSSSSRSSSPRAARAPRPSRR